MTSLTEEQFREMLARTQANMKGGDATSAESPRAHTEEPRRGGTSSGAPNAPYTASKRAHGPNKWEQSYAQQELEPRRLAGEIAWYGFEEIRLVLAEATTYTPDFLIVTEARGALRSILKHKTPSRTWKTGLAVLFAVEMDPTLAEYVRVVEIKGFLRDGAGEKFKIAASLYPFRFTMLRKKKVSEGGGWEVMRDLNVR